MTHPLKMTSEILYERLLRFAKDCQELVFSLPKNTWNHEYSSQLIRSSASPGANYIEAIEASSPKDFTYRLKICRKESKESVHWLILIKNANLNILIVQNRSEKLISEAREFIKIFASSVLTSERNQQIKKVNKW